MPEFDSFQDNNTGGKRGKKSDSVELCCFIKDNQGRLFGKVIKSRT